MLVKVAPQPILNWLSNLSCQAVCDSESLFGVGLASTVLRAGVGNKASLTASYTSTGRVRWVKNY